MGSPFLYFADDRLSPAELSAARLDGHLVELGDAYIPADAVETAALRAGSLGETLGDTLAATHLSAAWIHGALPDPPVRHTVQRAVARRLHHVMGVRLIYRDTAVAPEDLQVVGGFLVTTPERTVADLARVGDLAHQRAMRLMEAELPGIAEAAAAWLERHGPVPHKRDALLRLHEAGRGPVLRTT